MYEYIVPILSDLCWVTTCFQVRFKVLVLICKVPHWLGITYLNDWRAHKFNVQTSPAARIFWVEGNWGAWCHTSAPNPSKVIRCLAGEKPLHTISAEAGKLGGGRRRVAGWDCAAASSSFLPPPPALKCSWDCVVAFSSLPPSPKHGLDCVATPSSFPLKLPCLLKSAVSCNCASGGGMEGGWVPGEEAQDIRGRASLHLASCGLKQTNFVNHCHHHYHHHLKC